MASSASDAPLSPQAVDRAIALLRAGHKCRARGRLWNYAPDQGKFWSVTQVLRDNEWAGGFVTEEQMRTEIAQYPAAFRQMLTDAL